MSDDIVTRLRMSADLMVGFPKMLAKNTPSQWLFEAADEIERLRAELQSYYDEDEEIRRGRSGD